MAFHFKTNTGNGASILLSVGRFIALVFPMRKPRIGQERPAWLRSSGPGNNQKMMLRLAPVVVR